MYEDLLEFPEGWGGVRKNPFYGGGVDILWNYTRYFLPTDCILTFSLPDLLPRHHFLHHLETLC